MKLDDIYIERGSWERSNPLKIISSRIIREHLYEAESVVDVENKIRLVAVNVIRNLFDSKKEFYIFFLYNSILLIDPNRK